MAMSLDTAVYFVRFFPFFAIASFPLRNVHFLDLVYGIDALDDGVEQFGEDGSRQELREGTAQLTISRGMVEDELLIHHPASQTQEPAREAFDSTAAAALPRSEQSSLAVAEYVSSEENNPPERKCMLPDVAFAFYGLLVLYKALLKPMSLKLLF